MIDVLSPCVTFNDHEGSTKSYSYVKDHEEPLGDVSFVPFFDDISVEYDPGTTTAVTLHNGSKILLTKMAEDYHPTDKIAALRLLHETAARGEYATGILYIEPDKQDFLDLLGMVDQPLAFLEPAKTRPGKAALDEIMESFR
ncbi:MAG: 2-oxoacid:ferredoxin oxidoreductase subunit beta, partial [Candidatus Sericytochromatia bacterium]|nr:2-oxoacid:ferredoxin oxidoreductase subunit beta [Candidatus Tanganyikabacteria bacterium]